jgi:hypothetical protein
MGDMGHYPTRAEMKTIRNWTGTAKELLSYIKARWTYAASGGVVEDFASEPYKLELHTAWWSGNEESIHTLQRSQYQFMRFYHVRWERGGHCYFEVASNLWEVVLERLDDNGDD